MEEAKRYRVWTRYQRPEDGTIVIAKNSFEARKFLATQRGMDITDVMARREDI